MGGISLNKEEGVNLTTNQEMKELVRSLEEASTSCSIAHKHTTFFLRADSKERGKKGEVATREGNVVQLEWSEGSLWMVCPLERPWLVSSPARNHEVP